MRATLKEIFGFLTVGNQIYPKVKPQDITIKAELTKDEIDSLPETGFPHLVMPAKPRYGVIEHNFGTIIFEEVRLGN